MATKTDFLDVLANTEEMMHRARCRAVRAHACGYHKHVDAHMHVFHLMDIELIQLDKLLDERVEGYV